MDTDTITRTQNKSPTVKENSIKYTKQKLALDVSMMS